MEFLAKRALFIASKHCRQIHHSNGIRLSMACFYNTSYQLSDQQGVIKERRDSTTERATRYDNNVENMAESAVQGSKLGEMAKETMDKAWDSDRNATRDVHETVVANADENVVDTVEYRTIIDLNNSMEPDNVEDHRERSEM